jgi:hypothetical protein
MNLGMGIINGAKGTKLVKIKEKLNPFWGTQVFHACSTILLPK